MFGDRVMPDCLHFKVAMDTAMATESGTVHPWIYAASVAPMRVSPAPMESTTVMDLGIGT